MNKQDWKEDARKLHVALVQDKVVPWSEEDKRFLALAFCGEAGELANFVKKQWRDGHTAEREAEIGKELADCRIYLELQAMAYGVDLDAACTDKLQELHKRWPHLKSVNSSTYAR